MNVKTIPTSFNPSILPAWARCHPEIIELCKKNLAFRCDIMSAKRKVYKNFLIAEAKRLLR